MHIIGNMLFLFVFADNIESTIGTPKFVLFYLLGGLAAHGAHIFFNMASTIPTVGASGAISAVMGAYLVMFPKSRIKMLVLIFDPNSAGVAWWAHIGGFVFGVLGGFLFRSTSTMLPIVNNAERPKQIRQTRAERRAARGPHEKYPGYL